MATKIGSALSLDQLNVAVHKRARQFCFAGQTENLTERACFLTARDAIYVPLDEALDDDTYRSLIWPAECAHAFVDRNTTAGLGRTHDNLMANAYYTLLPYCTSGIAKNFKLDMEKFLESYDNRLDSSIILDETFSLLHLTRHLRQEGKPDGLVNEIIKLSLDQYPYCAEPFKDASLVVEKFGFDDIIAIFFACASVHPFKGEDPNWLSFPLNMDDWPDERLMICLSYCRRHLDDFASQEDLLKGLSSYISKVGWRTYYFHEDTLRQMKDAPILASNLLSLLKGETDKTGQLNSVTGRYELKTIEKAAVVLDDYFQSLYETTEPMPKGKGTSGLDYSNAVMVIPEAELNRCSMVIGLDEDACIRFRFPQQADTWLKDPKNNWRIYNLTTAMFRDLWLEGVSEACPHVLTSSELGELYDKCQLCGNQIHTAHNSISVGGTSARMLIEFV